MTNVFFLVEIIIRKNATQKAQRTKVIGGGGTTTRYHGTYQSTNGMYMIIVLYNER